MNRYSLTLLAFLLSSVSPRSEVVCVQSEVRDEGWVQARVRAIEVKKEERRLDDIGWAKDIRDAKRLAKEHHRPVFLFTHDGRLNIGRC